MAWLTTERAKYDHDGVSECVVEDKFPLSVHPSKEMKLQEERGGGGGDRGTRILSFHGNGIGLADNL